MSTGPDQALAARDLELVREAAQGDASAFTRFYERHGGPVQLLVERLLGPGETADRVVVEAFEKTVRRLPLLGTRNSSPAIYVLTTARNGAYAALSRGRPESADAGLAALLALPSRQRELLALRELGLDDAQCAEVAGIEPRDVPAQIARARVRLADELDGGARSGVFVDARAELLLAAAEGTGGDPALHAEADERAGGDERFAAALSAVRAGARRIAELPAAIGADRLAAAAERQALGGAPPPPAAALVPTPAPDAPLDDGRYDDIVGDEAAWGIIDDDAEPRPTATPPAAPAEAPEGLPDELLDDEHPTAFSAPDAAHAPQPDVAPLTPQAAQPADPATGPSTGDTLDGWDALEWVGDDDVVVGPPTAAQPIAVPAPPPTADPDATQAFDAVAAGLADPDDAAAADAAAGDAGDERPRRRGRWLLWVLATLILFAAAAFAAYTVVSSDDGEAGAGASTQVEPAGAATELVPPTTVEDLGGDGKSEREERSGAGAGEAGDADRRSTSSGSSSGAASSGSGGASSPSSGGSASGGGGSSSSSGGGNATTREPEASVEGGESSSGGSVRGDATATTP